YFGWSYVNKINTGYFVSTTFIGLNLAQNCVHYAEKGPLKYQWLSEPYVHYRKKSIANNRDVAMAIWAAYNAGAYDKYDLSFPDLSHQLGLYAKATIYHNPFDYLQQVALSWWKFWKPSIMWNYDSFNFPYANKIFLLLWKFQKLILWTSRVAFIALIPYYFFKAIKTRKISLEFKLMSLVLAGSILQAAVTYGSNSRFSFPFEFIMVMLVLHF